MSDITRREMLSASLLAVPCLGYGLKPERVDKTLLAIAPNDYALGKLTICSVKNNGGEDCDLKFAVDEDSELLGYVMFRGLVGQKYYYTEKAYEKTYEKYINAWMIMTNNECEFEGRKIHESKCTLSEYGKYTYNKKARRKWVRSVLSEKEITDIIHDMSLQAKKHIAYDKCEKLSSILSKMVTDGKSFSVVLK